MGAASATIYGQISTSYCSKTLSSDLKLNAANSGHSKSKIDYANASKVRFNEKRMKLDFVSPIVKDGKNWVQCQNSELESKETER